MMRQSDKGRMAKRFSSAQDRLRRLEEAIKPYVDAPTPQTKRPKGVWLPGDQIQTIEPDANSKEAAVVRNLTLFA